MSKTCKLSGAKNVVLSTYLLSDFNLKDPIYRHKSKPVTRTKFWKLNEIESQIKFKEAIKKKLENNQIPANWEKIVEEAKTYVMKLSENQREKEKHGAATSIWAKELRRDFFSKSGRGIEMRKTG